MSGYWGQDQDLLSPEMHFHRVLRPFSTLSLTGIFKHIKF